MADKVLATGSVAFRTEGRLLQELGERLVASSDVALVELIKNAYDADASFCRVSIEEGGNAVVVSDDGNGMSLAEFKDRWMSLGTGFKVGKRKSRVFKRNVMGQKGIGRFAVRFLGNALDLETIAFDTQRRLKTRLTGRFNWREIDRAQELGLAKIPFKLFAAAKDSSTGTRLTIRGLKAGGGFVEDPAFRTEVLKIVSPYSALRRGPFAAAVRTKGKDLGFQVLLPSKETGLATGVDLADLVLRNFWARLEVRLGGGRLIYRVSFPGASKPFRFFLRHKSPISNGLFADIRFFPRRKGVFSGIGVDGRNAWKWVRENHGVGIVDRGFRVKQYGFGEDDWLILDRDKAHSERDWRSGITKEHFPIPVEVHSQPALNPMLNLASNFQLVGAVFVETKSGGQPDDLTQASDREGFIGNESFRDLVEVVRGGIEFLALKDKERLEREEARLAEEAAEKTREDLRAAIEYIRQSPTLTSTDKARLIREYSGLAAKLDEEERYDAESRRRLEVMSLLGVVSAFMTHESTRILATLEEAVTKLGALSQRQPEFLADFNSLSKGLDELKKYVEYTRTFIYATQQGGYGSFFARPQLHRISERFGDFAKEREIHLSLDVAESLEVPPMPVSLYSGVVLNLYTNGLKAIVAAQSSTEKRILFKAWNDAKWHYVEVHDTGVGVPPDLRSRIWDPGFTTTSRLNNPLGTGMGLGLSLVRQLVTQLGGKVGLAQPMDSFATCFQVRFPRRVPQ